MRMKTVTKKCMLIQMGSTILKVCSDEIMCGVGRHGHGTLFASTHLGLDVDAVTFGKVIRHIFSVQQLLTKCSFDSKTVIPLYYYIISHYITCLCIFIWVIGRFAL